jgi:hypothetical protein
MTENNKFVPFKVIGKPIEDSEIKRPAWDDPEVQKRIAEKEKYFEEHPDEIPNL